MSELQNTREEAKGRRCSLILFDWDGTLFDSDYLMDLAVESVLRRRGEAEALATVQTALYSPRSVPLLRLLRLPSGRARAIAAEIGAEFSHLESEAQLFDGTVALLEQLRKRDVQIGIVTGSSRARFDSHSGRLRVRSLFNFSVCGDEAPSKPDVAGAMSILSRSGKTKNDVAVVGNTGTDLTLAKALGVRFVAAAFCNRARLPLRAHDHASHATSVTDLGAILGRLTASI